MRPNIEVHQRRAKDIAEQDVIRIPEISYRFRNGKIRDYSEYGGAWREVLSVYRNLDELHAEYGDTYVKDVLTDLYELANDAQNRIDPRWYVIIRLLVHEESYAEWEDVFIPLFRFDLVDVQAMYDPETGKELHESDVQEET